MRDVPRHQDSVMNLSTASRTVLPSQLTTILLTVVALLMWLKRQVLQKRLTTRRRSRWRRRTHDQDDLDRGHGRTVKKERAANDTDVKMRHQ